MGAADAVEHVGTAVAVLPGDGEELLDVGGLDDVLADVASGVELGADHLEVQQVGDLVADLVADEGVDDLRIHVPHADQHLADEVARGTGRAARLRRR